jgi:hypothetical protein
MVRRRDDSGGWCNRTSGRPCTDGIQFRRDLESKVAVWCSITAAWLAYYERYAGDETLLDDEERRLLGALAAISTGVEDATKLNVPAEVGLRLLRCYDDLGKS